MDKEELKEIIKEVVIKELGSLKEELLKDIGTIINIRINNLQTQLNIESAKTSNLIMGLYKVNENTFDEIENRIVRAGNVLIKKKATHVSSLS